jgi:glutamate synthase (NADPH/NADH) large chain
MKQQGLYDPWFEHDACGVGFVVNVNGTRSHQIVDDGITILKNLVHRGAMGGDSKTGDGAGMLIQVPHLFFAKECERLRIPLPQDGAYGVGMFFLPLDEQKRRTARSIIESTVIAEGGKVFGWREVPVHPECLGELARATMPAIVQVFVGFGALQGSDLERRCYITRKSIERASHEQQFTNQDIYAASFSSQTITYKGLFVAPQFEHFFPDLTDPDLQSALALIHQRYSTNTFPSWPLAQPFRYVAHNGEINTLRGNINKMSAREKSLASPLFGDEITKLFPIVDTASSDSGIFDNVFELLTSGGRSVEHAMMMMVPEAFGAKYHISEDKRAFYEYHAAIMEPWDGPAAIAFTDGIKIGVTLDRNGLRPARYVITKGGKVVMASEVGVLDIAPEEVLHKGRLAPGKMFLIDTALGRIVYDNEIKASVSRRKHYRRWLEQNRIELKGLFQAPGPVRINREALLARQWMFGYSREEIKMVVQTMAENAQEPVLSMGNDAALAVLSSRPQLLYTYFKQLFAQVTNPPIDPYRENLVMSLMIFIGRERNLLDETPEHCNQLKLPHPVLSNDDVDKLRNLDYNGYRSIVLPMTFYASMGEKELEAALRELCVSAERKVDQGYSLLILSDRDVSESKAPIPALLATAAVHHHLVKAQKRQLTALIIETGEVRDVMHFATLLGYGASAVNPYLTFEIIADLKEHGKIPSAVRLETAIENYITAVKKGLLKIMSKMGISTLRSYRSAQTFEAVGLNADFIAAYFPGTPSRIGGIGAIEIARETLARHAAAFSKNDAELDVLDSGGQIHYRRFSEKHLLTPEAVTLLQQAVRENRYEIYKKYSAEVNNVSANLCTLRGLFKFKPASAVPLADVEPVEAIVKRFVSSAMSFGSISKEAHETIAIAMNRLGAASNSGEGGEDEARYEPLENGDSKKSTI